VLENLSVTEPRPVPRHHLFIVFAGVLAATSLTVVVRPARPATPRELARHYAVMIALRIYLHSSRPPRERWAVLLAIAAPLIGGMWLWWPWYLATGGGPLKWVGFGTYMVEPSQRQFLPPDLRAYGRTWVMGSAERVDPPWQRDTPA
jgi:hypothetical protein